MSTKSSTYEKAEPSKPLYFMKEKGTCQHCSYEHTNSKSFPCFKCSKNYISQFAPKPIFTEEEITQAQEIAHVFGTENTIERTEVGTLIYEYRIINKSLLPSLLPGQTTTISEIIHLKENCND